MTWWNEGLPWSGSEGLASLILKNCLYGRSRRGSCESLDFREEVFEKGGAKGLQGGREHSSDIMIECIFSIIFCQASKLVSLKQPHPSH